MTENKLKHTPGQWEAKLNNADDIWIHSNNVSHIAQVSGPHERRQINANVRLIAAAPEMLEALIEQYKQICNVCNYNLSCDINPCPRKKKLQAIIEKATGLKIEDILKNA